MKRNILLVFLLSLSSFCVMAQIPGTISYQGYLTKANGSPADDGAHTVKFDFYDGSTKVMERGPISVTTDKGLFTTIIGSGSANNAAFTPGQWTKQLTVKMTVDGAELSNEVTLTSVPYAIVAGGVNAANVIGTLSATNIPNLDASKLTSGTIDNARLDSDIQDLGDGTLTSLNVDGFARLGTGGPSIKIKKLTGTTGATEGFDVGIAHGITVSKILGIFILIESSTNTFIGENYTINPELQYSYYTSATDIRVVGSSSNSGSLLSKPIKITIIYEQ